MYLQTLPVAERTYLFKELYIETKIRNPKGRKPPLPPGFGIQGLGFRVSGPPPTIPKVILIRTPTRLGFRGL